MTDPESRNPQLNPQDQVDPLFVYQIEYPVGNIFCIVARDVRCAADYLRDKNIEPFMIRRAGVLV